MIQILSIFGLYRKAKLALYYVLMKELNPPKRTLVQLKLYGAFWTYAARSHKMNGVLYKAKVSYGSRIFKVSLFATQSRDFKVTKTGFCHIATIISKLNPLRYVQVVLWYIALAQIC